ncbi:TIGR04211 family SH3 domain-containing protein [Desulfococcaceae bacterium HSG8]|nr:TIGR04211 family SH3 domain-containing protein [Desulfococcaceae bacterium HSG8]
MKIRIGKNFIIHFTLFFLTIVMATAIYAETRYISDILYVSIREGKGKEYRAIKTLTSDAPVEVLTESGQYLKVKSTDGKIGWILKKYVSSDQPESIIISQLKKEIEELGENTRKSREEASRAEAELRQISEKYNDLLKRYKKTEELNHQFENIQAKNTGLSTKLEHLRKENVTLRDTEMFRWFLIGGGVLFAGFIIGKLSGLSRKKGYY